MKVLLSFLIILLFSNSFANAAITTASITTTNIAVATALKSTTTASVIASNVVPSKNEFMKTYTTPSHTIIIYKCKNPESETKNWNDFRLLIALFVISIILCLYVSIVYP